MKKIFVIVMILTSGFYIFSRYGLSDEHDVLKIFKEINTSFHFNKKPIHPLLIQKFIPSMMCGRWLPLINSVDIFNAPGTNEYFGPYDYSKTSSTFRCYVRVDEGFARPEYYEYTWLGRIEGDIHVILTEESGGGTIVCRFLHFLKLSLSEAYTPEGKKYPQILLTFVRNYPLDNYPDDSPDRGCYDEKIDLLKNGVKITNSKGVVKVLNIL